MEYSPAEVAELLPHLTDAERAQLDELLADAPVWIPLPGPQLLAFMSDADDTGYGGAAGGGKTDLACGLAITQHRVSAIFRRFGTEHMGILDRMIEIIGSRDDYNGHDNAWRLPDGRQIELCAVPNPGDEKKYQGRPHDLLVFDEATNIPFWQIEFLRTWNRPARSSHGETRCRALYTFNPPTNAEGRWVVDFFGPWLDRKHPNPAQPGELRWYAKVAGADIPVGDGRPFVMFGGRPLYNFDPDEYPEEEIIRPRSRTFIPARVTDNPFYANSGYLSTLQSLPEPLRSQMLYGDFDAGTEDDPWQVCPTAWVEAAMARWKLPARLPEMTGLGVDVARGGKDSTVIARKHKGLWFDKPLKYPGESTPNGASTAGLVIAAMRDHTPIALDIIGVGSSPYDYLMDMRQPVYGINVAEASEETDKSGRLEFFNQRSMYWWQMREALDPVNNTGITLPPDKELLADLCAPTWEPRGRKIYVESREDIVKRIKRSPDVGTAYVLALKHIPKVEDIPGRTAGARMVAQRGHDPFAHIRRN